MPVAQNQCSFSPDVMRITSFHSACGHSVIRPPQRATKPACVEGAIDPDSPSSPWASFRTGRDRGYLCYFALTGTFQVTVLTLSHILACPVCTGPAMTVNQTRAGTKSTTTIPMIQSNYRLLFHGLTPSLDGSRDVRSGLCQPSCVPVAALPEAA